MWAKDIDFRDVIKQTTVSLPCKCLDGCTMGRKRKEWLSWPLIETGLHNKSMISLESLDIYPGSENESKCFWIRRGILGGFQHICLNHQKRRQLLTTLVAGYRNHFLLWQVTKQKILVYVCLDSNIERSPLRHGYALVIRSHTDKHSWVSFMHRVDSLARTWVGKHWAESSSFQKRTMPNLLWLIQQWTRNMKPQYFKWQERLLGPAWQTLFQ